MYRIKCILIKYFPLKCIVLITYHRVLYFMRETEILSDKHYDVLIDQL